MWKRKRKCSNCFRDKQKEKEKRYIVLDTMWMANRVATMVLPDTTNVNRKDIQTKEIRK